MEETYYKVKEVAELLKVTRQTVYNWIRSGALKAERFGNSIRISAEELERFRQR